MSKIKTFALSSNSGGTLYDTNIENILDTLRVELMESDVDENDTPIEYTITIEKKFTQEELDNMTEWDGF